MCISRLQAIAGLAGRDVWGQLAAGIAALGIPLDPAFVPRSRVFLEELERWNRVSRLTGYPTEAARVRHLVLDSLLFLSVLPAPATPLLDVGSGAGVPGLILKLARPEWEVHLVEANRRRANFLRQVARRLDVGALPVHEARAEALATEPEHRHRFAAVTARSVARPDAVIALVRPFLRPGGRLVVALGPGGRPSQGITQRVTLRRPEVGLRVERRFLIVAPREAGDARAPEVPRGTPRGED